MFSWKQLLAIFILGIFLSACSFEQLSLKQTKETKVVINKNCKNYEEIMNFAKRYVEEEFEKGYFSKNDILGAKAQLFLIKNKSQTVFAENINAALNSYETNYNLAQKEKCDLKDFPLAPLDKIYAYIEQATAKKEEK